MNSMQAWYRHKYDWFRARPRALAALRLGSKLCTRLTYAGYLGLCGFLLATRQWPVLARVVGVPAVTFLAGSALRAGLDCPRPYQVLGVPPLVDKQTQGKSFPSRHVFSAAVIAAAMAYCSPLLGVLFGLNALAVALCRVLVGVHWPRDVLAGLAFGGLCGLLGFFVL